MAATRWQAVAALVDPVRRALYEHVRRQDHPVTREEAADAIDISRTLSAFHLDKLVDAGLLRARYEAPPDKARGRGRTPKVYEATDDGLTVTVPPRQYELVGEILADAVAQQPADAALAAEHLAFDHGRHIGEACSGSELTGLPAGRLSAVCADRAEASSTRSDADAGGAVGALDDVDNEVVVDLEMAAACAALTDLGFEPRAGDDLSLRNCPFHLLAQRQTALICGINRAFIGGLLTGLGATGLDARLQPEAGACCVRVFRRPAA